MLNLIVSFVVEMQLSCLIKAFEGNIRDDSIYCIWGVMKELSPRTPWSAFAMLAVWR